MSAEPLTSQERERGAIAAAVRRALPFAPWDLLDRYEATVHAVETATIYLVIRDDGRAEAVFASHDEAERDRVLAELRASVAPHSGVGYHDDLILLDDRSFSDFCLAEAVSG